jgi:predicted RNA-binding protein with PUA-like domain
VKKKAYPDPSQFDKGSEYFDARARPDAPRWFCPDIEYVAAFNAVVPLDELRTERALAQMVLLKRGTRLSVQPVTATEFKTIVRLAERSLKRKTA